MSHTKACITARGGPDRWPQLAPLDRVAQDDGSVALEPNPAAEAVFACPHPTHYAYRFVWGRG